MTPSQIGPLNNRRQRDIVQSRVEDAVAKGAKVLVGGHTIDGPGNFFEPTVLMDVTPEMDIMNHETFGPVLPIMVMDDVEDDGLEANRSHLGLLAYVFFAGCRDGTCRRRARGGGNGHDQRCSLYPRYARDALGAE